MAQQLKDIGSILPTSVGFFSESVAPGAKAADGTLVPHPHGEGPPKLRRRCEMIELAGNEGFGKTGNRRGL